jgi:hypothetical protein
MLDENSETKVEGERLQSLFEYLSTMRQESLAKVDEVLKKVKAKKKPSEG